MNDCNPRPKLSKKEIENYHKALDELIELYNKTDPNLGELSENDKYHNALTALNKAGYITGRFTLWAEQQVFGAYYHIEKSNEKHISKNQADSHQNELIWHNNEASVLLSDNCIYERSAIAVILHNFFSCYGIAAWRKILSDSLFALNEGQVNALLTPVKTMKKGRPFDLEVLKWAAVKHIYILKGEGWPSDAAKQEVACKCGVTFGAIKKWERELSKHRDIDKHTRIMIEKVSRIRHNTIRNFKEEDPDVDRFLTIIESQVDQNLEAEKHADLHWAWISIDELNKHYPLDELGEALRKSGLKAA